MRPGALLVAAAIMLAAGLAGCTAGHPAGQSPLDESPVTATATEQAGPFVFPPAPTGAAPSMPGGAVGGPATEAAAGRAIDQIAAWLGRPATEFAVDTVEVVAWPDACLGIAVPGATCAQVVTPGERVTLRHRLGARYEVHLGARGAARWAASAEVTRTVRAIEGDRVTLDGARDGDGVGSTVRAVPGSLLGVPLASLRAGDRVAMGVAAPVEPGAAPLVWLVRAP